MRVPVFAVGIAAMALIAGIAVPAGVTSAAAAPLDTGIVAAAPVAPALAVSKSASPTVVQLPGETITYSYGVTNTGDAYLDPVTVTDVQADPAGPLATGPTCPTPTRQNLALRQPATQSSTLTGRGANRAVDGNVNGNASGNSTAVTNLDSQAWWQVDLGAVHQVSTVNVWNRTDGFANRLSDYWVFVSATPFDLSLLPAQQALQPGVWSNHQTTQAGSPTAVTMPAGTEGRYVMVQLTGANYLQLAEVQVLPPPGLAPGATIVCTATYVATPEDIAHGSISNTATAHGTFNGVAYHSAPSTAVVDVRNDSSIQLVKTARPSVARLVGERVTYSFAVTNTGETFLDPVTVTDTQALPAGPLDSGPTCPAIPRTNLAVGKPATQSSTYSGRAASRAVDGNTSGAGTSFSTTNYDVSAWWQVDLGAVSAIDTVNVFNRSTYADRLTDYWVFVSSTPFNTSLPPAQQALQPGVAASHQTTQAGFPTAIPMPTATEGRYVMVQLTGTNYLQLGEVQVLTEPGLAPGATTTCTATYTVTEADALHGSITNSAVAHATTPGGSVIDSAQSTAVVPVDVSRALTVAKTVTPTTLTAAGQSVTYSFLVTNRGTTYLDPVTVTDVQDAPAGPLATGPTCPALPRLNLAQGKAATQSTTIEARGAAGKAVDGNTNGVYAAGSVTATTNSVRPWWQVDMGAVDQVATINLFNRTDAASNRLSDYWVFVSATPFDTTLLPAAQAARPGVWSSRQTTQAGSPTAITVPAGVSGRYVMVQLNGSNILSLAEVQVFPPAGLKPGATTTCTGTYVARQADVDHGSITNTATASGTNAGVTAESPPSTAVVTIPAAPALTFAKTPSRATVGGAGDVITYTFTVTNTGNVTFDDVSIADEFEPPVTPSIVETSCPPVAPGATVTCTAAYTVTQADIDHGSIDNTAVAHATHDDVTTTSAASSASVAVVKAPALTLVKSAVPTVIDAVDDIVTYTFSITNTGNVTLDPVSVTDDFDDPAASDTTTSCPAVAPGATVTCTSTYRVTQEDLDHGSIDNTAIAHGTHDGVTVDSAPSRFTVTVDENISLDLVKSAFPTSVDREGEQVTYTFAVTNTGNVTLTAVEILDTFDPPATAAGGTVTCPVIRPGQTRLCTSTYEVTQDDIDHTAISNRAFARGTARAGTAESDPSSVTVDVDADPAVSLLKSASPAVVDSVGDLITYTFTIVNSGNLTLVDFDISDEFSGPAGSLDAPPSCTGSIGPGQSLDCTATYQVTQADLDHGVISNSATVRAQTRLGVVADSNIAFASVDVDSAPALILTKSADRSTADAVGDTVEYTFQVENTGNITLDPITVTDDFDPPASPSPTSTDCPPAAPGATVTCTATYTVTQADVDAGVIVNTATAHGTGAGTVTDSNPSEATVTIAPRASMTFSKTAFPAEVTDVGEVITYTFAVVNTGNVSLRAIDVTERAFSGTGPIPVPDCGSDDSIASGETLTCVATYTVTAADALGATLTNRAAVAVTPANGPAIETATSDATVALDVPAPPTLPGAVAATGLSLNPWIPTSGALLLLGGCGLLFAARRPRPDRG